MTILAVSEKPNTNLGVPTKNAPSRDFGQIPDILPIGLARSRHPVVAKYPDPAEDLIVDFSTINHSLAVLSSSVVVSTE